MKANAQIKLPVQPLAERLTTLIERIDARSDYAKNKRLLLGLFDVFKKLQQAHLGEAATPSVKAWSDAIGPKAFASDPTVEGFEGVIAVSPSITLPRAGNYFSPTFQEVAINLVGKNSPSLVFFDLDQLKNRQKLYRYNNYGVYSGAPPARPSWKDFDDFIKDDPGQTVRAVTRDQVDELLLNNDSKAIESLVAGVEAYISAFLDQSPRQAGGHRQDDRFVLPGARAPISHAVAAPPDHAAPRTQPSLDHDPAQDDRVICPRPPTK